MIRVTVELLPRGREEQAVELAVMDITNLDYSRGEYADYVARSVTIKPNGDLSAQSRVIQNYPRLKYTVWGLISQSIFALGLDTLLSNGQEPGPWARTWGHSLRKKMLEWGK